MKVIRLAMEENIKCNSNFEKSYMTEHKKILANTNDMIQFIC